MELSSRAIIAGRYRAETRLGAGAMGEVWAGTHVHVGVRVAIKRLLPAGKSNHESLARFRREAQLLGRVKSDYVARVLDFVDDDAFGLVLVMELVEGQSLYDLLNRRRFSVEEAIDIGIDIMTGLCDLHMAQIVHRDLKPGNIILEQRSRGRPRARLVDFGMSRVMQGASEDEEMTGITRADTALGTLEYMAPEQMLNSRGVTGAADIYAVGCILYRAVAGRHAFKNDDERELIRAKLMQECPPLQTGRTDPAARGLEHVVARALRRKPEERYQSAEEMLADLETVKGQARGPSLMQEEGSAVVQVEMGSAVSASAYHAAMGGQGPGSDHAPFSLVQGQGRAESTTKGVIAAPTSSSKSALGWAVLALVLGVGAGALLMQLGASRTAPTIAAPMSGPQPVANGSPGRDMKTSVAATATATPSASASAQ